MSSVFIIKAWLVTLESTPYHPSLETHFYQAETPEFSLPPWWLLSKVFKEVDLYLSHVVLKCDTAILLTRTSSGHTETWSLVHKCSGFTFLDYLKRLQPDQLKQIHLVWRFNFCLILLLFYHLWYFNPSVPNLVMGYTPSLLFFTLLHCIRCLESSWC